MVLSLQKLLDKLGNAYPGKRHEELCLYSRKHD